MPIFIDQLTDLNSSDNKNKDIISGLMSEPPEVSPRYFYDTLGSKLFSAITDLPEYYPTRLEREILTGKAGLIANSIGLNQCFVDLGAGDGEKASILLPHLKAKEYIGVDISGEYLYQSAKRLKRKFPTLKVTALACDFFPKLLWPSEINSDNLIFFYPGSSIGNFSPDEALKFLKQLNNICLKSSNGMGDLLIGVDLVKDTRLIENAYDDVLGLTSCFNLNLLRNLNKLLKANFDVRNFRHYSFYNSKKSRVEMWLLATKKQNIKWCNGSISLNKDEGILTEFSYKYTKNNFTDLLSNAGFFIMNQWTDLSNGFMVCHARSSSK